MPAQFGHHSNVDHKHEAVMIAYDDKDELMIRDPYLVEPVRSAQVIFAFLRTLHNRRTLKHVSNV